jgi:hypothetical protein
MLLKIATKGDRIVSRSLKFLLELVKTAKLLTVVSTPNG